MQLHCLFIEAVQPQSGVATGDQLTASNSPGEVSSSHAVSPLSTRAVFIADKDNDGVNELFSANLTTGVVNNISGGVVPGGNVINFSISADGAGGVSRR